MDVTGARFFFDLVDPLSYVVEREVVAVERAAGSRVARVPLELRPPPSPLLAPGDEEWETRWTVAREAARSAGPALREPAFLPWSRKAHELVLHAAEVGHEVEVRGALFRAVFQDGEDVGRVDVLVEVARAVGLDAERARVVLGVDRHAARVMEARDEAAALGIREPPAVVAGERTLRGFHKRDALSTFLGAR